MESITLESLENEFQKVLTTLKDLALLGVKSDTTKGF